MEEKPANLSCNPFKPETFLPLKVSFPSLFWTPGIFRGLFLPLPYFFLFLFVAHPPVSNRKLCPILLPAKEGWTNDHVLFAAACSSERIFLNLYGAQESISSACVAWRAGDCICKRFRSPRIDSKESISPGWKLIPGLLNSGYDNPIPTRFL